MIDLVLVFCLATSPTACVERRPLRDANLGSMGCMVAAQPLAASFLREHPRYVLQSWRCEIDKPPEGHA